MLPCWLASLFRECERGCESPRPHHDEPPTSFTNFALWLKREHNLQESTIASYLMFSFSFNNDE